MHHSPELQPLCGRRSWKANYDHSNTKYSVIMLMHKRLLAVCYHTRKAPIYNVYRCTSSRQQSLHNSYLQSNASRSPQAYSSGIVTPIHAVLVVYVFLRVPENGIERRVI